MVIPAKTNPPETGRCPLGQVAVTWPKAPDKTETVLETAVSD